MPRSRTQTVRDFFMMEEAASFPASSAFLEASDLEKQRSTSLGWAKMLTAAIGKAPSVPTMMRSVEARRIMKSPSKAAGSAIFK